MFYTWSPGRSSIHSPHSVVRSPQSTVYIFFYWQTPNRFLGNVSKMAAVSLLRLAESLLLKTVSTYISFWVFITQAINYYITFIALGCNQTIRAYYLACCSNARELCILIAYNLGLKAKLPLIYFEWKQKTFNFKPWQRNIQIPTYHLEPFI